MEMNSGTNRQDYRRQVSRCRNNSATGRRDGYTNHPYNHKSYGFGREPEITEESMHGGCGCGQVPEAVTDCGCQAAPVYTMWEAGKKKDCPKVNAGCSIFEEMYPVGMAYVPMQEFTDIYEIEKGFHRGTVFAQLDYPFLIGFCAGRCGCK